MLGRCGSHPVLGSGQELSHLPSPLLCCLDSSLPLGRLGPRGPGDEAQGPNLLSRRPHLYSVELLLNIFGTHCVGISLDVWGFQEPPYCCYPGTLWKWKSACLLRWKIWFEPFVLWAWNTSYKILHVPYYFSATDFCISCVFKSPHLTKRTEHLEVSFKILNRIPAFSVCFC